MVVLICLSFEVDLFGPSLLLQSTDLVLWTFGVMDTLACGAATLVAPDLDRELNIVYIRDLGCLRCGLWTPQ